jgi:hypothetical protein
MAENLKFNRTRGVQAIRLLTNTPSEVNTYHQLLETMSTDSVALDYVSPASPLVDVNSHPPSPSLGPLQRNIFQDSSSQIMS